MKSGVFEGGSEIGDGICVRKAGTPPGNNKNILAG